MKQHARGLDAIAAPATVQRLDELRLKEMDEAGIDLQVLSHTMPGFQNLDAETTVPLARRVNDRLNEAVRADPKRFAAFAALPTADPKAAADELERTVGKLGFKGAMVNGLTNGVFFDDKRFWPIFKRAQALDVPLYLHPATPLPPASRPITRTTSKNTPGYCVTAGASLSRPRRGHPPRAGVFDAYPRLKITVGHLGEGLPFYLWRISHGLRGSDGGKSFRDIFCEHFYVTTSGFFSGPALLCCVMEMGIDRILFSVDYPFVDNPPATKWTQTLPLCAEDKEKLLSANAKTAGQV